MWRQQLLSSGHYWQVRLLLQLDGNKNRQTAANIQSTLRCSDYYCSATNAAMFTTTDVGATTTTLADVKILFAFQFWPPPCIPRWTKSQLRVSTRLRHTQAKKQRSMFEQDYMTTYTGTVWDNALENVFKGFLCCQKKREDKNISV